MIDRFFLTPPALAHRIEPYIRAAAIQQDRGVRQRSTSFGNSPGRSLEPPRACGMGSRTPSKRSPHWSGKRDEPDDPDEIARPIGWRLRTVGVRLIDTI